MKRKVKLIVTASTLALAALTSPFALAGSDHDHGKDHGKEEKTVKPYPLTTCIVSDDKLGEMGKPVVFEYEGQEIKLCCKDCRKDFDKDPARYLKKLVVKK